MSIKIKGYYDIGATVVSAQKIKLGGILHLLSNCVTIYPTTANFNTVVCCYGFLTRYPLEDGEYEMTMDSTLKNTNGELVPYQKICNIENLFEYVHMICEDYELLRKENENLKKDLELFASTKQFIKDSEELSKQFTE